MRAILKNLTKRIRKSFFPSEHDREYKKWQKDGGDERLRFEYDLKESSLVIDLGGYKGQWASDIYSRYNCHVLVFEPMTDFAGAIEQRFGKNSKIEVFPIALGRNRRQEYLSISGDSSSIHSDSGEKLSIQVEDVSDFFGSKGISKCDLMKINIEGGEYELLDRMIDAHLIDRIDNLQIQFHDIGPQSDDHMQRIQKALSRTHEPTYQYKFVWENWVRRDV